MLRLWWLALTLAWLVGWRWRRRPEIFLPQARTAYRCDEAIEVAVVGLGKRRALLRILGPADVDIWLEPQDTTICLELAADSLAPGPYRLVISGARPVCLRVVSGVQPSSCWWSEAGDSPRGNFQVLNLGGFGLLGQRVVGRLSAGMSRLDRALGANKALRIYTVWTGWVTHQPWGPGHSWGHPQVQATLRLFSLHAAQRLRRFGCSILGVGMIDEPLLSCGRDAHGQLTPGLPAWDEIPAYQALGGQAQTPAWQDPAQWLAYLKQRQNLLRGIFQQARSDLRTCAPELPFVTDFWAPEAVLEGCEIYHQELNDVPCSHVFSDRGGGKFSVLAALALARAHSPALPIAQAMNGRLPEQVGSASLDAYLLLRNVLLASGLHSHWWLNCQDRTLAEMERLDAPVYRLGPFLQETQAMRQEIALLWSFREIGGRAREALSAGLEPGALCQDYKEMILNAYQAVRRAGYGLDILHEDRVAQNGLEGYRVLLLLGQTEALAEETLQGLVAFQKAGGQILQEQDLALDTGFWQPHRRWVSFQRLNDLPARSASFFRTTLCMDETARSATPHLAAALAGQGSIFQCSDSHLMAVRRRAGQGWLTLLINGCEELPAIDADESYPVNNLVQHAPSLTLGSPEASKVYYLLEGEDWSAVRRMESLVGPQQWTFAAGEMKWLLACPKDPEGLTVTGRVQASRLELEVRLDHLAMPWPLQIEVRGDGQTLFELYRATDESGCYQESFPLGANSPWRELEVTVSGQIGGLVSRIRCGRAQELPQWRVLSESVRVFDEDHLRQFLGQSGPVWVVGQQAELVAQGLNRPGGLQATVKRESEVARKVCYPRVWPAYLREFRPGPEHVRPNWILDISGFRPLGLQWLWPRRGAVARVGERGWYDRENHRLYQAGCLIQKDAQGRWQPLGGQSKVIQADPEIQREWSRPWDTLQSYLGGQDLCPQTPEAWQVDEPLILLGNRHSSRLIEALLESELLLRGVDSAYPGRGRGLLAFAWSPFAVGKNVVLVGAADRQGMGRAIQRLLALTDE